MGMHNPLLLDDFSLCSHVVSALYMGHQEMRWSSAVSLQDRPKRGAPTNESGPIVLFSSYNPEPPGVAVLRSDCQIGYFCRRRRGGVLEITQCDITVPFFEGLLPCGQGVQSYVFADTSREPHLPQGASATSRVALVAIKAYLPWFSFRWKVKIRPRERACPACSAVLSSSVETAVMSPFVCPRDCVH